MARSQPAADCSGAAASGAAACGLWIVRQDMASFLRQCFERTNSQRPSALELLEHPWIVSHRPTGAESSQTSKLASSSPVSATATLSRTVWSLSGRSHC